MQKSSVEVELRTIQETVWEVMSVSKASVPEIDSCKVTKSTSFEEMHKNEKEGTVLLIGDSLARVVGNHLKLQHRLFERLAFGGARIEDIAKKVEELKDRLNDSHIVLMVGTIITYSQVEQ